MQNIYFISESLPLKGHGSFVIFYRHLNRLQKKGFKIHIIIPDYEKIEESELYREYKSKWEVTIVPFRKWWFMPFRYYSPILRYVRYRTLFQLTGKRFKKSPPDYIISYMHGQYLNGFASFLSKYFKCPLGLFLHDDKSLLTNDDSNKILQYDILLAKQAERIWTVSEELFLPQTEKAKYLVLPPIPEGSNVDEQISWKEHYQTPVIGFSGLIYESYIPLFGMLAEALKVHSGRLVIIGRDHEEIQTLCNTYDNITKLSAFATNDEAFMYLKKTCSAMFCGYPNSLQEMPWLKSCFPSKFVEFSHLQLPVILSSPPGTSLSNWANSRGWKLYTEDFTVEGFSRLINLIVEKQHWLANSQQASETAQSEFNPDQIQRAFENSLLSGTSNQEDNI